MLYLMHAGSQLETESCRFDLIGGPPPSLNRLVAVVISGTERPMTTILGHSPINTKLIDTLAWWMFYFSRVLSYFPNLTIIKIKIKIKINQ